MPGSRKDRPTWYRLAGIGFEFFAAVAGFTLIGYWIGNHYGRPERGVLIGAILGLVGGLYNLIRESLLAVKRQQRADREKKRDDS